jgi:hypothetical protein
VAGNAEPAEDENDGLGGRLLAGAGSVDFDRFFSDLAATGA